ncbi:MAG: RNA polymerase sigma factor RpoE [Magnetococcales bacterium]|nr:RNA polymerase sigma factor RpoE [Magnetococcales bacterium]
MPWECVYNHTDRTWKPFKRRTKRRSRLVTDAVEGQTTTSEADRILVGLAQKGDNKAFEVLVRRYQGKVAAVISRVVSDPDKVRDLTQETFIKAYRALEKFRGESAFYTWLYRIAINTGKNHLQARDRGPPMSDLELEDSERMAPQLRNHETPERLILRQEMMTNLRKAIDALPDAMRQAIHLRDVEGHSYEEIAKALQCPIGTVRSRIYRSRQEVMDRMQGYLQDKKPLGV